MDQHGLICLEKINLNKEFQNSVDNFGRVVSTDSFSGSIFTHAFDYDTINSVLGYHPIKLVREQSHKFPGRHTRTWV